MLTKHFIEQYISDHVYHIYGTPQSKQSRAPEKGRNFFETPPKNCFFLLFFRYTSYSWCKSFRKYQVSIFRCYLGCVPHTQSWVFFQNGQNTAFLLLYYSASKKATERVYQAKRISCCSLPSNFGCAEHALHSTK